MRVYSTNRPIGLGTWPSQYRDHVVDMVHFDHLTYVPEIRHNSFGYIDFDCDIPQEELYRYELRVPEQEDPMLEKIGRILADFARKERYERLEKGWQLASERYGYTDEQIGDAIMRRME